MTRLYYREASACIIMFDVTNVSTFGNSQKWKQDLDSKLTLPDGNPVPCLLLANKVSSLRRAPCARTRVPGLSQLRNGRRNLLSLAEPCPELYRSLWAFHPFLTSFEFSFSSKDSPPYLGDWQDLTLDGTKEVLTPILS